MRKEVVGGVIGLALFAGATAASLPIGIAAAAGALGYFGGWLMTPSKKDAGLELLDVGVNRSQLEDYLKRLRKSADDLQALSTKIVDGRMQARVGELRAMTLRIIDTVTEDPRDIRNEPGLPIWAEKIVERVAAYVKLTEATGATEQGMKHFTDCKLMVERAVSAFEQIHRDMLNDDMTELSAGSNALRDILETKIRKDQEARS